MFSSCNNIWEDLVDHIHTRSSENKLITFIILLWLLYF